MADTRFDAALDRLVRATDRARELRVMEDEEVVAALAAASRTHERLLANILATEALNRVRRLRGALHHLAEGVVTLTTEGSVTWANPAAEALLGWTRSELIGEDLHDLLRHQTSEGEPIPREQCRILGVVRRGAPARSDGECFLRRDRTTLCAAYGAAPLIGLDGEPLGIVVAFSDITERERSRQALVQSEQRFRSLFEGSSDLIVSLDLEGRILAANPAAVVFTGIPLAESVGRPFTDFLHEDDAGHALDLFADVVQGASRETTLRVRADGGGWRALRVRGIPIVVDDEVVGVHGVARPTEGSA